MKIASIARREVEMMLKEKSFVLILLLEALLVSSSGLLSTGYLIITSPESSGTLSQLSSLVYVGVVSNTPRPLTQVLSEGRMQYKVYPSFSQARTDLQNGLIDALLLGDIAVTGNKSADERPSVLTVFLPSNSPKAPLTKLALKKAILGLEDRLRERKVGLYYPQLEFTPYKIMDLKPQARQAEIYFIFTLPLLLFLPCIVSGSLAIDSITQDLESKRMLNLVAAPLSPQEIVFGKALASLLLSLFQSALWLVILSFTFISPKNPAALIAVCGLYSMVFMNAGTLLALHLKKMRASQILYTFVSMSAISLFSPFANVHPLLLDNSPSYILARVALGTPPAEFASQLAILFALAAATTAAVAMASGKVAEP
jgi:ABC-2 type transport system permease protein